MGIPLSINLQKTCKDFHMTGIAYSEYMTDTASCILIYRFHLIINNKLENTFY
jgi:hypothetical protein